MRNVLNDEIDELVLQHRLRVEVGDQERDVISLSTHNKPTIKCVHNQYLFLILLIRVQYRTHRNSLPPQNNEPLRSHGHEPSKFLAQDPLDLIGLFDTDGQPDRVDRGFDEDAFGFVTRDEEGLEEGFLRVTSRYGE